MQHLEVRCAVRPIQWPLGVKWLRYRISYTATYDRKHPVIAELSPCNWPNIDEDNLTFTGVPTQGLISGGLTKIRADFCINITRTGLL